MAHQYFPVDHLIEETLKILTGNLEYLGKMKVAERVETTTNIRLLSETLSNILKIAKYNQEGIEDLSQMSNEELKEMTKKALEVLASDETDKPLLPDNGHTMTRRKR